MADRHQSRIDRKLIHRPVNRAEALVYLYDCGGSKEISFSHIRDGQLEFATAMG